MQRTIRLLKSITQEYNEAVKEKRKLEADLADTRLKLARATALLADLAGEERRWSQQVCDVTDVGSWGVVSGPSK